MEKNKGGILAQVVQAAAAGPRKAAPIALAGVLLAGLIASFAVAPNTLEQPARFDIVIEPLATQPQLGLLEHDNDFIHLDRIQKHDTLGSLLSRVGIQDSELTGFIRSTPEAGQLARNLRPGDQISAAPDKQGRLQRLNFPVADGAVTAIQRDGDRFKLNRESRITTTERVLRSAEIEFSLFAAADRADIPDAIAVQLTEIFASDIDFHRDLRKGDRFSVIYEQPRVHGQASGTGRILAAEFTHAESAKTRHAVYFESEAGRGGYYDENGRSLKKAFLRSPLEFSRVTSGYQISRFHPVLQRWRAHRGVDYGAPIGAHVRTTSDGVIEFAGRQDGYGNIVIIRHGRNYSTAYAHLNGFAKGIRKGTRVSQGEMIGYVGSTGLASGPHLHYEFRINGNQVDPLAAVTPEAPPLDSRKLPQFRPRMAEALTQLTLAKTTVPLPLN